jgi:hypothetical protein
VTRDLRSDVAVRLGRMLQESLGTIGTRIAEGAAAEHQQRATTRQDAYAALRPG